MGADEFRGWESVEEGVVALCISVSRTPLLLGHEYIIVGFAA